MQSTRIEFPLPDHIPTNNALLLLAEKLVDAQSTEVFVRISDERIPTLISHFCSVFQTARLPSPPGYVGLALSRDSLGLLKRGSAHLSQWLASPSRRWG